MFTRYGIKMATKAKRHIHKYARVPFTYGSKVWACRLPDCNHYMPKHLEATVEGKSSICWQCGNDFILDIESMDEDTPRCKKCRGIEEVAEQIPLTDEMKKRFGLV